MPTPAPSQAPRHALVTGASAGIGAEMVRLLAAEGWTLTITARSGDRLRSLAREVDPDGERVRVVVADLSTAEGLDTVAQAAAQASPPLELLVNNAGFGQWGAYPELDRGHEADMIQLNVTALTQLTRAVLPEMVSRRRGRILNVGSVAGFFPGPYMTTYYATKAYVLSYSEALAVELEGTGVTVTCLCPGATRTEFQDRAGMVIPEGISAGVMSARAVARAGIDGALAGRTTVVPGFINRVAVTLPRFLPRRWVTKMMQKIQGARRTSETG